MLMLVAFREITDKHFFKAAVVMLMGFDAALGFSFHGNGW